MIKKACLVFSTILLTTFSLAHAEIRVAVVDVPRVLAESAKGQAVRQQLEGEAKKKEASLKSQKAELDNLKKQLSSQSGVLAADVMEEKSSSLQKKEREFARRLQDAREEVAKRNQGEVSKILKDVESIIKKIADEDKYDLILERDGRIVLFASKEYDITEEVVARLNKGK